MFETYSQIFSILSRRDRRNFVIVVLIMLAAGAAEVVGVASVLPLLAVVADPGVIEQRGVLSFVYDRGGFGSTEDFLAFLCLAVFVVVIVSIAVRVVSFYLVARFTRGVVLTFSQTLLTKYLQHPYEWHIQRHSADLAKSLLSETKEVVNGSITPAMRLISDGIVCVTLLCFLFAIEPVGALTTAVLVGVLFGLIYLRLRGMLERLGEDRRQANRERFQLTQEALSGIKDVKVLGLEDAYIKRFYGPSRRLARHMAKLQLVGELPRYFLEAIGFGGMLVFLFILLWTNQGNIAAVLPILGAFAMAGLRLLPTAQLLFKNVTMVRFNRPALRALFAELTEVSAPRPARATEPLPMREAIALDRVSYRYPGADRDGLRDLSLTIPAGASVGFVGTTGAGKTTVIDVILGLLPPTSGRLLVDGEAIDRTNVRAWQRAVGYVAQDVHLVDGTIASNIAYGVREKDIDRAAVERAATQAMMTDFVSALPMGLDTEIGEGGIRLSGGQRQRIAIARALYRDPDVIVMDEATSALDTLTEQAVMDAVGALSGTKTVILITHRLSTVRACDRIFVLDHGVLAEEGGYDELTRRGGVFARLTDETAPAENPA